MTATLAAVPERPPAVVLLSGGLDSATCLAVARVEGFQPIALSFRYGQRHAVELEAARAIAAAAGVEQVVVEIDLAAFGGSALTDTALDVPKHERADQIDSESIPITYVPARNTIFLSYALALAEVREANDIFIGVNALDYSGYPDCRPEYIAAFTAVANLATRAGVEGAALRIHTPLIDRTKAEIIRRGDELGVDFARTVSCYDPDATGAACGHCDSCLLRAKGFADAHIDDPTRYASVDHDGRTMSTYAVKETFYTLQGEGARAGRPAVFCRFARCNLWSGIEAQRADAVCRFCDTDFVGTDGPGGGVFHDAAALATHVAAEWPADHGGIPYVVCTGGEPLLQLDTPLIDALHAEGFEIAIETNGTLPIPEGIDWVCMSPKADAATVVETGDELKLIFPQERG